MKKILFLFILIIVMAFPFACSTKTHVDDSSFSSSSSSGGQEYYTLTVNGSPNGRVEIEGGKTQARLGEKVTLNIIPDNNCQIVWIKINNGNNAEDQIVYLQDDVNDGRIEDLLVEHNMVIDAYFANSADIVTIIPSYEGAPTSSSATQTFKVLFITSVGAQNFSVSKSSDISEGEIITVTATAQEGYQLSEIIVRKSSTYEIVGLQDDNSFIMPKDNVAVMANFVRV